MCSRGGYFQFVLLNSSLSPLGPIACIKGVTLDLGFNSPGGPEYLRHGTSDTLDFLCEKQDMLPQSYQPSHADRDCCTAYIVSFPSADSREEGGTAELFQESLFVCFQDCTNEKGLKIVWFKILNRGTLLHSQTSLTG